MTTWNIIEGQDPTWTDVEALGSWTALEDRGWQVTASGASTSSGSASAELVRAAAASGSSISSGSADAVRLLASAASGASASSGSAEATVPLRQAAAAGASASAGSAAGLLLHQAAASGASSSSGSADAVRLLAAAASGSSTSSGSASAIRVARAPFPPDAILAVTNLDASPVADIQDDPDSPDAAYADRLAAATATAIRVSFPTPSATTDLIEGAGQQEFRIFVRAR